MKQVLKQSGWTILMSLITAVSAFGISLLSARVLGPEGRGGYVLALLVINTASFVANPGLYAAANYFASTKKIPLNRLIGSTLFMSGICAIGSFLLAIGSAFLMQTSQTVFAPYLLVIIGLGAAAATISISLSGILFGSGRAKTAAILSIVSILLHLGGVTIAWLLESATLELFILFTAVMHLFDALTKTILVCYKQWPQIATLRQDFKPILTYGGSVYSGRVLMLLAQKVDTWLLFLLAGQAALGFYSIATSFAEQLWMIPTAVSMVMMANIGAKANDEAADMSATASQTVLAIALPGALVLGIGGIWLIPFLYGEAFAPSVLPFALMLPGILFVSSYLLLEPYFQSRGKPLIPVKITIGGAIANFTLSILLIPPFGLVGAGIAYSTSYFFQLLLTCFAFRNGTQLSILSPVNVFSIIEKASALVRQQLQQRKVQAVP